MQRGKKGSNTSMVGFIKSSLFLCSRAMSRRPPIDDLGKPSTRKKEFEVLPSMKRKLKFGRQCFHYKSFNRESDTVLRPFANCPPAPASGMLGKTEKLARSEF